MTENVPIATLSGITTLTDLIPELPLPTPVSRTRNGKIFHSQKVAEEAKRILKRPDMAVIRQIVQALSLTKAGVDQIKLKKEAPQNVDFGINLNEMPALLQVLVNQAPHLLGNVGNFDPADSAVSGILAGMSPHQAVLPASNISPPGFTGSPTTLHQQLPYGQPMHHSPQGLPSPRQMHGSPSQLTTTYGSPPMGYSSPQQGFVPLGVQQQVGFVNGESPAHTPQAVHQENSTPAQTLSPLKTRRQRQLSNSSGRPDIAATPACSTTASNSVLRQTSANTTSISKNLGESQWTAEQENQQPLQPNYVDLVSKQSVHNHVEECLTKNGYSIPTESLKGVVHVETSEKTFQPKLNSVLPSVAGTNNLQQDEQISKSPAPISGKRRKSSKSRHSLDTDKNNTLDNNTEALPLEQNISDQEKRKQSRTSTGEHEVICQKRRHSSRSSIRSGEENIIPEDGEVVVLDSSYSFSKDSVLNRKSFYSSCVPSVDTVDKDLYHEKVSLSNIPDSVSITSPKSADIIKSPVGTPLREMQLCIPKLIIKKVRQRKGSKEFETHEVRAVEPVEDEENEVSNRKKRRRSSSDGVLTEKPDDKERARKQRKTIQVTHDQEVKTLGILDTVTFRRFGSSLESLFDFDDECDAPPMPDIDDEEPDADTLAPRPMILELYTETAKLKSLGVVHQIPVMQLIRLVTVMERHIRDGMKLKQPVELDDCDEEQKLWREICMDRMIRSIDAALVVLNILTSPHMPKTVYLEEVMDRIIRLIKFQLQNTIFPEYDPIYKIESDSKEATVVVPKSKRSRSSAPRVKTITVLYNKLCELTSHLADLVDIQSLTDTTILQVSTLGTSSFFVENVSELQHSSLKLVRTVFRKYVKHRELILEDIFASLARLPSSKRNLRAYRLNGDDSIQMVTALVLQLIQCSVKIPEKAEIGSGTHEEKLEKVDEDLLIITSYENAMRTAQNFLTMFLSKCSSVSKDEEDYRPLFENFVQDLLVILNKPDWPAAELLLTLLGKLLVVTFNNRANDVSLRVSSIEYLGVVAAHLRKDAVVSQQQDAEIISEILVEFLDDVPDDSDEQSVLDERSEKRIQVLQKVLFNYLTNSGQSDQAFLFSRQFLFAQWLRDTQLEMEKCFKNPLDSTFESRGDVQDAIAGRSETEEMVKLDEQKKALHGLLKRDGKHCTLRSSQGSVDYERAYIITKFLSSSRSFSRSFDIYLHQILRVLNESAVAIRTKAMKALSAVVTADPSILSREDMRNAVHARFVDMSTSVREAAVELIGRFVLNKPELTHQYYDMLIERILDTGISVRKRVIKILRDICINQPNFPKATEICVKIIRRINDEEGIKELVTKVFQQLWFTPAKDEDDESRLQSVIQMTDVVAACGDGNDWFEQLLENLLKSDEETVVKSTLKACTQVVRCLVENVLRCEENAVAATGGKGSCSQRLVASLCTLYLISKIQPVLLVQHATILQPYLSTKCNTQGDYHILHNVARILELVVPLMEHPSETFLASLEEDLMRLSVKHGQTVVMSCLSCLGAVVNKVTHNVKLVRDYFQKYYNFLAKAKVDYSKNQKTPQLQASKPTLLRSLFTLGLLCKQFDFDSDLKQQNQASIKDKVFAVYSYFTGLEDEDICSKAISGLGFLSMRYPELLLKDEAKDLYHKILSPSNRSNSLKLQVLKNLQTHLIEEEKRLKLQEHHESKQSDKENLKELGDSQSGMTSAVMQIYLKNVLELFFHDQFSLRNSALHVVCLILRQGLVHPAQCVPYLIAIGADNEKVSRVKADQQLTDIDNKYSGFVQMKALAGIKMSFQLQKVLQQDKDKPIRGYREENHQSLLGHMYLVVRSGRQTRRSLLQAILRLFDAKKSEQDMLLYVADNLAHFPYSVHEEPLFVIHHIDMMLSVTGSNIMQSFTEAMLPPSRPETEAETTSQEYMEEDEGFDKVLARIPSDSTAFKQCCSASQSCLLLLLLKRHLKEMYGFSDSKCHKYSPSERNKAFEKAVARKPGMAFSPVRFLEYLEDPQRQYTRDELAQHYCDFKNLMMQLDPTEDDSDDSNGRESPVGESAVDAEGNPKPLVPTKIREKRAPKPRKVTRARKTLAAGQLKAKGKQKPRKKKRKLGIDADNSGQEESGEDDPDFVQ